MKRTVNILPSSRLAAISPENYDAVEALIDDLGLEFLGAEKV